MARLPNVGGDNNIWGKLLNDFLGVEHNPDGSQKTLPLSKGGTGATDAATARSNIGAINRIQDATDVDLSGVSDGDQLQWDAATGKVKHGNGGSITSLPASNGRDDTTAIQAILDEGGNIAGQHGESYIISSPLAIKSGTRFDMTGCTVTLKAAADCNMLNNAAVAAARTVMDASVTASSATLTSATGAFTSADVGATVFVYGAGADGTILRTNVASVTNSTTVELSDAASVTLGTTWASIGPRDSNIQIVGGTWARGSVAGGAAAGSANSIRLRRCDNVTIRDLKMTASAGKYAINFGDATDFVVERITFDTSSDGVHLNGPIKGGTVKSIRGFTGDDTVSITPNDWSGQNDVYGDITDVLVQDVKPYKSKNCAVKILGGSAIPLTSAQRITVRDIGGYATVEDEGFGGLVYVGDDSGRTTTTGGWIDDIAIEDIHAIGAVPTNVPAIYTAATQIGKIRVSGVQYDGSGRTVTCISFGGPAGATIDDAHVENVRARNVPGSGLVQTSANATVKNLSIRDLDVVTWSGTNSASIINPIGPVTVLSLDGVNVSASSGGAVLLAGNTIGQLAINDVTLTSTSNTSYLLAVAAATVTAAVISNVVMTVSTGYIANLQQAASAISRLQMENIDLAGGGSFVQAPTSTQALPAVQIANAIGTSLNWLADLNTTTALTLTNVRTTSAQNGAINCRANASITIRGRGNSVNGNERVVTGGMLTLLTEDLPFTAAGGGVPTLTWQAGAGTGATGSITGSDKFGSISQTTGTTPASGNQIQVGFTQNLGTAPRKVQLMPTSIAAVNAGLYIAAKTSSNFMVAAANAPSGAVTFDYEVTF